MLILSRKQDESIQIGDGVTITIVDIRGDRVRIGVSAPKETPVHRREVWEALKRLNQPGSREAATQDAEGERDKDAG